MTSANEMAWLEVLSIAAQFLAIGFVIVIAVTAFVFLFKPRNF